MQSSFMIEQQSVSSSPRRTFATTALVGVLGLFAVACIYNSGDTSALRPQQRLRAFVECTVAQCLQILRFTRFQVPRCEG